MTYTETEALVILRHFVVDCGTQRVAARRLGISEVLLSEILQGHRPLGTKAAAGLGLEPVVMYRNLCTENPK